MKKKIFFIIVISYILLPHATFATSGWISSDNNIYYYENEVAQTGHQTIDGYKYYFDEEGKMYKGFLPEKNTISMKKEKCIRASCQLMAKYITMEWAQDS